MHEDAHNSVAIVDLLSTGHPIGRCPVPRRAGIGKVLTLTRLAWGNPAIARLPGYIDTGSNGCKWSGRAARMTYPTCPIKEEVGAQKGREGTALRCLRREREVKKMVNERRDDTMTELEKAEARFIKARSAIVNSFDPTDDQWAEYGAASAELVVQRLAEMPGIQLVEMPK